MMKDRIYWFLREVRWLLNRSQVQVQVQKVQVCDKLWKNRENFTIFFGIPSGTPTEILITQYLQIFAYEFLNS